MYVNQIKVRKLTNPMSQQIARTKPPAFSVAISNDDLLQELAVHRHVKIVVKCERVAKSQSS